MLNHILPVFTKTIFGTSNMIVFIGHTGFPPYLENLENLDFCSLIFQM